MDRIESVIEKSKIFYDNGDPAHDVVHIARVMRLCEQIGKEEGANLEVLLAAAALHDLINLPKDHPERQFASQMAATQSMTILKESGFTDEEIEKVKNIITEHSYSLGKKPTSLESAVLQDADKLDALGAIGIMRTVTCGARFGAKYYDMADPFAKHRDLDDRSYTLDHFSTKLFKLPSLMNTNAGKIEATKRFEFMKEFIEEFRRELDC